MAPIPSKKPISITIDENLLAWLDQHCEQEGSTRSAFIERLVRLNKAESEMLTKKGIQDMIGALRSPNVLGALAEQLGMDLDADSREVISDELSRIQKSSTRKTSSKTRK